MPTINNICFMENQQLTTTNVIASSEESGYPIENIVDPIRSRIYKTTSNVFTLTIDLGVNASIDFVGMVGPISEYFGISDAATITLKANSIPASWGSPPFSQVITPELTGIFAFLINCLLSKICFTELTQGISSTSLLKEDP